MQIKIGGLFLESHGKTSSCLGLRSHQQYLALAVTTLEVNIFFNLRCLTFPNRSLCPLFSYWAQSFASLPASAITAVTKQKYTATAQSHTYTETAREGRSAKGTSMNFKAATTSLMWGEDAPSSRTCFSVEWWSSEQQGEQKETVDHNSRVLLWLAVEVSNF